MTGRFIFPNGVIPDAGKQQKRIRGFSFMAAGPALRSVGMRNGTIPRKNFTRAGERKVRAPPRSAEVSLTRNGKKNPYFSVWRAGKKRFTDYIF